MFWSNTEAVLLVSAAPEGRLIDIWSDLEVGLFPTEFPTDFITFAIKFVPFLGLVAAVAVLFGITAPDGRLIDILSNGEPIRFFSTMPPTDFLFVEKVLRPFLDCIAAAALLRVSPVPDERLIDEWTECAMSLFFSTKSPTDFLPFGPLFIPLLDDTEAAATFLSSRGKHLEDTVLVDNSGEEFASLFPSGPAAPCGIRMINVPDITVRNLLIRRHKKESNLNKEGKHKLHVQASSLPQGQYLYCLQHDQTG